MWFDLFAFQSCFADIHIRRPQERPHFKCRPLVWPNNISVVSKWTRSAWNRSQFSWSCPRAECGSVHWKYLNDFSKVPPKLDVDPCVFIFWVFCLSTFSIRLCLHFCGTSHRRAHSNCSIFLGSTMSFAAKPNFSRHFNSYTEMSWTHRNSPWYKLTTNLNNSWSSLTFASFVGCSWAH